CPRHCQTSTKSSLDESRLWARCLAGFKGVQLANLANDTHWERGPRQGTDCQCLLRRIVGPTTERCALGSAAPHVARRSRWPRGRLSAEKHASITLPPRRLRLAPWSN